MTIVPSVDLREQSATAANDALGPMSVDAEQAILGALMFDNAASERLGDLEPRHFGEPYHARLFAVMEELIGKGHLAEPIVLMERFKRDPAFEELGGLRYLADLVDRAPPGYGIGDYARVVIDMALRREMLRIAKEAEGRASDTETTARQHLEEIEAQIFDLAEAKGAAGGFSEFATAVDGALEMAEAAAARDTLSGISTGLIDLDQKLGGLHPSDLLILAGRPSMGKTALATNIAYQVARSYAFEQQADGTRKTTSGGVVGFFSLEMSAEQLAGRIISERAGISGDRVRKGHLGFDEIVRYREAAAEIRRIPLHIDATGGLSIAKLCARARRLKRRHGLDLLVVDYLQLATGSNQGKANGRVQEVSEITMSLKALAKELNVPILALSQLSRQVESRDDKRPQLSDLRESGSIEQDADCVMFVYRESYYLARTEPAEGTTKHLDWQTDMEKVKGVAEVIIGKQRHGPIGTVRLHFEENTTKFSDLAREERYPVDFSQARVPYGGAG